MVPKPKGELKLLLRHDVILLQIGQNGALGGIKCATSLTQRLYAQRIQPRIYLCGKFPA